jgi:hypothetical protein
VLGVPDGVGGAVGVRVGVRVGVGVVVGEGVSVGVGDRVGVGVAVFAGGGVEVLRGSGVCTGALVGVGDGVLVGCAVGRGVTSGGGATVDVGRAGGVIPAHPCLNRLISASIARMSWRRAFCLMRLHRFRRSERRAARRSREFDRTARIAPPRLSTTTSRRFELGRMRQPNRRSGRDSFQISMWV